VTVIPNGVNIEQFPLIEREDAGLRTRLGLDGAVVLGFLGSFYGYEGLDVLLDAMPEILRFEPRARILLVGGGKEEEALASQSARLQIQDKVTMVGRVPHDEVARYYGLVDLLVFPRRSIRLTETVTPLKPLEAMAQGRVVLASNVGGHRELIKDGKTGILFAPDEPAALAAAVRTTLDRQREWPELRIAARRFVESERTWRASVARYRPVYDRLVRAVEA
jgi:glycosyltransferase involved in cell wall biosynthesis